MNSDCKSSIKPMVKNALAIITISIVGFLPAHSQIKYTPGDERKDAGMGAERVARFFTPAYESKRAESDNSVR